MSVEHFNSLSPYNRIEYLRKWVCCLQRRLDGDGLQETISGVIDPAGLPSAYGTGALDDDYIIYLNKTTGVEWFWNADTTTWVEKPSAAGGTIQPTDGNTYNIRATDEGLPVGNARGENSVDVQTKRLNANEAATGLASTISGGERNRSQGAHSVVGGGYNNASTVNYSSISGGIGNRAQGVSASISGGSTNTVTATGQAGFIGGGVGNSVDGQDGVIGGGASNQADGTRSTVGGGLSNEASGIESTVGGGDSNIASGSNSTIGGGVNNNATQTNSTVAGGSGNDATDSAAAIGGGSGNEASGVSATVAGGASNTASQNYAAIAGGQNNTASGFNSSVGGGLNNLASFNYSTVSGGEDCNATGTHATVAGGEDNDATSANATVSGGRGNIASGQYSTVTGGFLSTASADYSSAGGRYAVADQYGQRAYASGFFTTAGDAQGFDLILRRATTDASDQILFMNGSSIAPVVPTDTSWTFVMTLTARRTDVTGDTAHYHIIGGISNNGGTTAIDGTPVISIIHEDNASLDVNVVANDTTEELEITVNGIAAQDYLWVANARFSQVTG
jgi:hypothetical protein